MKIKAIEVIPEKRQEIRVEINPRVLLEQIHWAAQVNAPKGAQFIRDGYWYVQGMYDYHKGYHQDERGRKATTEEQELWDAFVLMRIRYREAESAD